MADSYALCLIGAMDRLWFQKIILFPESTSLLVPKTLKQHHLLVTESLEHLSSTFSLPTDPPKEEVLSDASSPLPEDDSPSESKPESVNEEEEEEEEQQERPTRLNPNTQRARSHSSSPSSTGKRPKTMRRSSSLRRLKKSMSCRTLGELELEEVRGFMDLGFIFKKEYLSPRMMSVVPGLQRLGLTNKNKQDPDFVDSTGTSVDHEKIREEEEDEDEDEKGIIRPYLSEAWLINRPDSPLLSLRIPRVSAAADIKKHLKFWARTVASVVKQEC